MVILLSNTSSKGSSSPDDELLVEFNCIGSYCPFNFASCSGGLTVCLLSALGGFRTVVHTKGLSWRRGVAGLGVDGTREYFLSGWLRKATTEETASCRRTINKMEALLCCIRDVGI